MDGITFKVMVFAIGMQLAASFDASMFSGLTQSQDHSIEHVVEHRWNKRSTGEDQAPHIIHTRIIHHGSDVIDDVNLKFRRSERTVQTPIMFKGSDGNSDYRYSDDIKCVWLYSAEDRFAHAVVDGCHSDGYIRMVAEVYVNNTQHVILPTESGLSTSDTGRAPEYDDDHQQNVVHHLYTVNAEVNFKDDYHTIDWNSYGEQVHGDTEHTATIVKVMNNTDTSDHAVRPEDSANHMFSATDISSNEEPAAERVKRGTAPSYVVELMLVIDYTLYQFWYNQTNTSLTAAERETAAITKLQSFYAFLTNSINVRYNSLQSFQVAIQVELASLYILKTPAEGFSFNTSTTQPRGTMNAAPTLVEIKAWVENKRATDSNFPVVDHTMLLTARDVILSGSSSSAGYANLDSMCTLFSVSVTEDHFDFISSVVAAHELGHSIGGRHDGDGNTCHSNDGYILATSSSVQTGSKALHPWQFSTCSGFQIRTYLAAGTFTCLTTNDVVPVITPSGDMVGQTFTADEQCKHSLGPNSELARVVQAGNFAAICTGMWCTNGTINTVIMVLPADGTTCGNNKWCINGQCTSSSSAPAVNDVCPFGDQPGEYTPGLTCSQTVQQRLSDCLSSQVQSACCQACEAAKSSVAGCPYGDRTDCSAIAASQCYGPTISNDNCCRTCKNFEKSYLPSDCLYGDKNINCAPRYCTDYPVQCCGTCSNVTAPTTVATTAPVQTTQNGTNVTAAVTTATTATTTTRTVTDAGDSDSDTIETRRWLIPVAAGVGTLLVLFGVAALIRWFCCRKPHKPQSQRRRYKQNIEDTWSRGLWRYGDRPGNAGKHSRSPRQPHKSHGRNDGTDFRSTHDTRDTRANRDTRTHSLV